MRGRQHPPGRGECARGSDPPIWPCPQHGAAVSPAATLSVMTAAARRAATRAAVTAVTRPESAGAAGSPRRPSDRHVTLRHEPVSLGERHYMIAEPVLGYLEHGLDWSLLDVTTMARSKAAGNAGHDQLPGTAAPAAGVTITRAGGRAAKGACRSECGFRPWCVPVGQHASLGNQGLSVPTGRRRVVRRPIPGVPPPLARKPTPNG